MKKNQILGGLILLFGIISLAGCTQQTEKIKDTTPIENKEYSVDQSEYAVDQSDMLNTHTLLTTTTGTITEAEKIGLIKMREEEKLARDVYTMLGEKRGNKIFTNIAQSEQTHTDAVKELLAIYGIEDPVKDNKIGVFTSKEMGNLYEQLIAKGSESAMSALIVGATIEDLDIKDLNELLKDTTNTNIITVYDNLNKGSRNHMRAFVKNIEKNNGTYSPQYISSNEYTTIISASQETSMGRGRNQK